MTRAALIVLGYGQFDKLTRHCLDSVLPAAISLGVPVLAVDNASPDDSASQLQAYGELHPELRVLLTGENLGFAGGMNLGVAATDADWIVLVNSDTRFASDALARLIDAFGRAAADVGIIGPLTNAAGNGQYLALEGETPETVIASAGRLLADDTGVLIPCYRADFFCVGIRRSLWASLGGLDTVFGKGYYEDFDFSMRALRLGFISAICEDAFVYHAGSSSFKRTAEQKQLIRRNKEIFLSRHPDARMPHRRDDNLAVLIAYARLKQSGVWNEALETRQKLRAVMLMSDLPRNPLKRWLWRRKVRKSGVETS
ncbi:glycosyltransferase family 2 protein [Dechloromonas sp. HYN0024]|uniref:glycosyltransferase family 2 protein n=1 Tax=Dechloromonas sp. HYN0024 TaxID=2231055 RepID=UPI000E451469|nr:glycosyltransferase family 2 protein [Dechloromonas sp. HYN0024]AXS78703.1 glycosyltransferase family 2 protein [Dechloromonas sp. HYN0024]